nr:EOG090X0464 [Lepidurus arcticus]
MNNLARRAGASKLSLKKKPKAECKSPDSFELEGPPELIKSDFAVNLTPVQSQLTAEVFFSTKKRLALGNKERSLNDAIILADDSDLEDDGNVLNAVKTQLFTVNSDDDSDVVEIPSQKTSKKVLRESIESAISELDNSLFGPSQKENVQSWISGQPFQAETFDSSPPTLYSQKDDSLTCLEHAEEEFLSISAHYYHEPNLKTETASQRVHSITQEVLSSQLKQLSLHSETNNPPKSSLNMTIELTSDDDEDNLKDFFQKVRSVAKVTKERKPDHSFGFIDDSSRSSEDSMSMYLTPINPRRIKSQPVLGSQVKERVLPKPQSIPDRIAAKKEEKSDAKRKQLASIQISEFTNGSTTCSFLGSLSSTVPIDCHPEAVQYISNFKKTKESLTQRLFQLFNKEIFDDNLPGDMEITWNARLLRTAGYCRNMFKKAVGGSSTRLSRIELSSKVLDDAGRLRDTLVHELCHAAVWVNHSVTIGRHSKSVDVQRQVCPVCKSWLHMVDTKNQGKSAKENEKVGESAPNAFALFVKHHYKDVKASRQGLTHKEVMQMLSTKFAAHKLEKAVQLLTLED